MKKKEKKGSWKKVFWVILTLALIAASIFLFLKDEDGPKYSGNVTDVVEKNGEMLYYKYNNFEFVKKEGVWYTEVQRGGQPFVLAFIYGPINVENVSIRYRENSFPLLTKPGSKVYVSLDHDSSNFSYMGVGAINLIKNMNTVWGINASRACLKSSPNCAGAPIVDCKTHPDNAVIQFVESNKNMALYENNCLTIYASKDDFIRVTEKIILDWYGII